MRRRCVLKGAPLLAAFGPAAGNSNAVDLKHDDPAWKKGV